MDPTLNEKNLDPLKNHNFFRPHPSSLNNQRETGPSQGSQDTQADLPVMVLRERWLFKLLWWVHWKLFFMEPHRCSGEIPVAGRGTEQSSTHLLFSADVEEAMRCLCGKAWSFSSPNPLPQTFFSWETKGVSF